MDKFFVNPGSATGAFLNGWGDDGEGSTPSFCLMDVSFLPRTGRETQTEKWGLLTRAVSRSKGSLSHCMSTSSEKTSKETRRSRWKKSHTQSLSRKQGMPHSQPDGGAGDGNEGAHHTVLAQRNYNYRIASCDIYHDVHNGRSRARHICRARKGRADANYTIMRQQLQYEHAGEERAKCK